MGATAPAAAMHELSHSHTFPLEVSLPVRRARAEPKTARRFERGDANPTLATLVSVAAAFELPLHELLAELA